MNWMREPDAEPLTGYRLIKPLGTGGFGEVWMCEAPGGILKAIKFVYGNLNAVDGDNVRAEQEFRALQKVKEVRHPFVLTIERIDVCDGELAIVMELADKSLYDSLVEHQELGRLGVPREHVLSFLSDAAEGLDYLVDRYNLLHLDIKPRNLFLVGNRVKVADFGLVKSLERQSSSGLMGGMSPMYAAPETFRGDMSRQSDQYSLAIVYMELLTGQRPFTGRNMRYLALQHMCEEPDLKALPAADRSQVARALAKDPNKRFPSCLAFIRALTGDNRRPESIVDISEPTPLPRAGLSLKQEDLTPPTAQRYPTSGPSRRIVPDSDVKGGSRLNVTMSEQEVGVIRPAIVIGIGSYGLKTLRELRSRLLDRLGDHTQTPAFRFLYVDIEPGARDKAVEGEGEHALQDEQIFEMKLQPIANYRKRILEHLSEWLPREKLFAIPRSLHPQGSRALGRLAFSDNYLRFDSRLGREIKLATHPDALARTMTQTGLNLRDNCPRVYVIASALGCSSGLLADVGFSIRRRLVKSHFTKAPVISFLYCGAPHDPSTPQEELANLYASLTELHHFRDPAISFSAQYGGPDGPKLVSEEWPFTSIYLMQRESRSHQSVHDCAANLASYLAQDLSSPLGAELDHERDADLQADHSPFRSFGAAGIWFPKGLMLRSAARLMCVRLLLDWQDTNIQSSAQPIEELCESVKQTPSLQPEAIAERLEQSARFGRLLAGEELENLLDDLERTIPDWLDDPGQWAKKSVEAITAFVGAQQSRDGTASYLQCRLSRTLAPIVNEHAAEMTQKLAAAAAHLMEVPGQRTAAAEEAIKHLARICYGFASYVQNRLTILNNRSTQAWNNVRSAIEACIPGSGFRLFGSRPQRNLKTLSAELRTFALARLNELLVDATYRCFRGIAGGLEDHLRDLSFCRQRLGHLQEMLESNSGGSHPDVRSNLTNTSTSLEATHQANEQILLPFGERDVEWAAARFVQGLSEDQWTRLDEVLHSLVLAPMGGLHAVCQKAGDLMQQLAGPLIDQTTAYLSNLLTVGDVSRAEFVTAGGRTVDLIGQIRKCVERSEPMMSGAGEKRAYLVVPGSETGSTLGEEMAKQMPEIKVLHSVGQTSNLMVCQELGNLSLGEVQELLGHCREAYQKLSSNYATSPHSRFDIVEWMPLDV